MFYERFIAGFMLMEAIQLVNISQFMWSVNALDLGLSRGPQYSLVLWKSVRHCAIFS